MSPSEGESVRLRAKVFHKVWDQSYPFVDMMSLPISFLTQNIPAATLPSIFLVCDAMPGPGGRGYLEPLLLQCTLGFPIRTTPSVHVTLLLFPPLEMECISPHFDLELSHITCLVNGTWADAT